MLALALAPAYVLRFHVGPIPSNLLEAAVLATFAAFAIETLLAAPWVLRRTAFDIPAALFVLSGIPAIIVSPYHRNALGLFKAYLVEPVLFFYVLTMLVRTRNRLWWTLGGLATGGTVVALLNLGAFVRAVATHQPDIAVFPPVAIYTSANAVPLFLVPMLAVSSSIVMFGQDRWLRLGAGAFSVVALLACVFSFSRGGFLALVALLIGLSVAHPRRLRLLLAGGLGIVLIFFIPPFRTRLGIELDMSGPHNSLPSRLTLWRTTLEILSGRPLFGTGLASFSEHVSGYTIDNQVAPLIYPHNIILNFWVELGLLGLVSFAWLMFLGLRDSLRGWRSAVPALRAVPLGVCLALVTMIVHGLVDVPYFKNDLSLEFWALLGIQWVSQRLA